mgnify:CR=1 FL=1
MRDGAAQRASGPRRTIIRVALVAACVAAVAGCGGSSGTAEAPQQTAQPAHGAAERAEERLIAQGRRVYREHCASCHGLHGKPHTGTTGEYGPNFDDVAIRDAAYVRFGVEYGGYGMQSFANEIPEEGKRAVVAFVLAVAGRNVAARSEAAGARVAAGRAVFDAECRTCHRLEGRGATAPPEQVTFLGTDFDVVRPSARRIRHMIEHGDWWMPALRRQLGERQIEDVIAYITKVAGGGRFEDPHAAEAEQQSPPPPAPMFMP